MTELTHKMLLSVLRYEPETGHFFWLVNRRGKARASGTRAGAINPAGKRRKAVWRISLFTRKYTAARVAWFYMTGAWPIEVDHRDTDCLNDRWGNLREATRSQNEVNKGAYRTNKTGVKGVSPLPNGRFRAQIMRSRRKVSLGDFATVDAAQAAYLAAAAPADGAFLRAA